MMDEQHLIFISYASPDRDRVNDYYDFLSGKGLNLWMDKRRLKGGQNWDFEIKRALQKAAIIVVFLSSSSVDRRGYAQREIKIAFDQAREKLVDDIYIVPVMLDQGTPIPEELERIQVIRPEDGDQMQATAEAIALQLERLGAETARIQIEADVRWTMTTYKDTWDGLPGYDVSFDLPRFQSEVYPQVGEISDVLRGWLIGRAMEERQAKFDQSGEHYNFGQSRYRRQNSCEATPGEPKIKNQMLSIAYSVWWYGAGAAHPNLYFKTFAFTLDPVTQIEDVRAVFTDADAAFSVIQNSVRESLSLSLPDDPSDDDHSRSVRKDFVTEGTQNWDSFRNFLFVEDGIEFLFGSYQVACYADGPQSAIVPYIKLFDLIREPLTYALGLEHMRYARMQASRVRSEPQIPSN